MGRTAILVSVIIPLRNRTGVRLENCLRSLRWQDLEPAESVEIVVSDFGSNAEQRQKAELVVQDHGATVAYMDTDEIWNRSRALNYGIRNAAGKYILCTDVDMIFEPNFLRTLVEEQRQSDDSAFVVCGCRDLTEDVPEQAWAVDDYSLLKARALFREKSGTGACQMAVRHFFFDTRGYDERYMFWGMEDNDMRFRAKRFGLTERWVHEKTSMLHQWHPSDRKRRPFRKFLNDMRFHLTKYRLVKNPGTWGGRS